MGSPHDLGEAVKLLHKIKKYRDYPGVCLNAEIDKFLEKYPVPDKCPKCKWCSSIVITVDGGWRCADCKYDSYTEAKDNLMRKIKSD